MKKKISECFIEKRKWVILYIDCQVKQSKCEIDAFLQVRPFAIITRHRKMVFCCSRLFCISKFFIVFLLRFGELVRKASFCGYRFCSSSWTHLKKNNQPNNKKGKEWRNKWMKKGEKINCRPPFWSLVGAK